MERKGQCLLALGSFPPRAKHSLLAGLSSLMFSLGFGSSAPTAKHPKQTRLKFWGLLNIPPFGPATKPTMASSSQSGAWSQSIRTLAGIHRSDQNRFRKTDVWTSFKRVQWEAERGAFPLPRCYCRKAIFVWINILSPVAFSWIRIVNGRERIKVTYRIRLRILERGFHIKHDPMVPEHTAHFRWYLTAPHDP